MGQHKKSFYLIEKKFLSVPDLKLMMSLDFFDHLGY